MLEAGKYYQGYISEQTNDYAIVVTKARGVIGRVIFSENDKMYIQQFPSQFGFGAEVYVRYLSVTKDHVVILSMQSLEQASLQHESPKRDDVGIPVLLHCLQDQHQSALDVDAAATPRLFSSTDSIESEMVKIEENAQRVPGFVFSSDNQRMPRRMSGIREKLSAMKEPLAPVEISVSQDKLADLEDNQAYQEFYDSIMPVLFSFDKEPPKVHAEKEFLKKFRMLLNKPLSVDFSLKDKLAMLVHEAVQYQNEKKNPCTCFGIFKRKFTKLDRLCKFIISANLDNFIPKNLLGLH